jgi:hypothetical protein
VRFSLRVTLAINNLAGTQSVPAKLFIGVNILLQKKYYYFYNIFYYYYQCKCLSRRNHDILGKVGAHVTLQVKVSQLFAGGNLQ